MKNILISLIATALYWGYPGNFGTGREILIKGLIILTLIILAIYFAYKGCKQNYVFAGVILILINIISFLGFSFGFWMAITGAN